MKVDEIVKMLNIISEEVMSLKEKNQKEGAEKEENSLKNMKPCIEWLVVIRLKLT